MRVAIAGYEPRTTGGFEALINASQRRWPENSPQYAAWKRSRGLDTRVWVRTGKTLKALTQGRLKREGTSKGLRLKVLRNLKAYIRPTTFKPTRGKKPASEVQKKILRNLEGGIDSGRRKPGGVRGRTGRELSGFPARPLLRWTSSEIPGVEAAMAAEVQAILREQGLAPR